MKVITFSRQFPATHPRKGEPTQFVERMLLSLIEGGEISMSKALETGRALNLPGFENMNQLRQVDLRPKHHTIRRGQRWKVGDKFSPRVWSGRPYASKQIEFAPPIEIVTIYHFQIILTHYSNYNVYLNGLNITGPIGMIDEIAKNDGLSRESFLSWFGVTPKAKPFHFAGQILCWNPDINYEPCI